MPHVIWNHSDEINGCPAELVASELDVSQSDIVILVGPNPPMETSMCQAHNPTTGTPWASEAEAVAWAQGLAVAPPPPPMPPTPEMPPPPPTLESLHVELQETKAALEQAHADRDEIRAALEMVTDLVLGMP